MEVQTLIEMNDTKLKNREDRLLQEVNQVYDKAVEKATEKLKELNSEELTRESVKRVLEEVSVSFSLEFEKLAEPFRKAILESYDEGLKETGNILEENKNDK
jgi:TRAP-type C4-dicarboxylate transport system substrate-binding protein